MQRFEGLFSEAKGNSFIPCQFTGSVNFSHTLTSRLGFTRHQARGGLGEGVQMCSSFVLVHPVSPLCFTLVMPLEANKPGVELQFNSDCLGDLGKKMSSLEASPSSSIK